jgi:prepilin peptidase CpaA
MMGPAEILAVAWCGAAIAYDARTHRIPNVLTIGAASVSGVCFGVAGQGPLGGPWAPSVMAGGAVGLVAFVMFAGGRLGAGDVKFMASLPLVGGPARAMIAFYVGSGLLLIWFLAIHVPALAAYLARYRHLATHDVPLAVPFGLGFLASIWCLR